MLSLAAGETLVAQTEATQTKTGPVTIESISLLDTELGAELEILTSGSLRWTLRYNDQGGFALRLPGAVVSADVSDLTFDEGLVSAVTVTSVTNQAESSILVEVVAREPLRVSVEPAPRLLSVRILPVGEAGEPETPEPAAEVLAPDPEAASESAAMEEQSGSDAGPDESDPRLAVAEATMARMSEVEEELRFELERVRAERDALAWDTSVHEVADDAIPCLNVRTEPDGDIVDCLEPGTPVGALLIEDQWAKLRLPDGRDAWARYEYLKVPKVFPSAEVQVGLAAVEDALVTVEADLEAARERNRSLLESAESAEQSLEDARRSLALGSSSYVVHSSVDPCLNLRPEPESEARIDCLAAGTRGAVVDLLGAWSKFRLADGRIGWVSTSFLEPAPDALEELQQLEAARSEIERLLDNDALLTEKVDEAEQARVALEADLASARAETESLRQGEGDVATELAHVEALEAELLKWRERAEGSERTAQEWRSKVEGLEAEIEEWREGSEAAAKALSEAQAAAEASDTAAQASDTAAQASDTAAEASDTAAKASDAAAKTLETELATLRAKLREAGAETAELDLARTERDRVQAALVEARSVVAERDAQLAALEEVHAELQSRLESDDREARRGDAAAVREAEELRARLETADQELKTVSAERTALSERVAGLQADLEEGLDARLSDASAVAEMTERVAALQNELSSLESELAAVAETQAETARLLADARDALELGGATFVVSADADPCLNLRSEPQTGLPVDCLVPGTRVAVLEVSAEWVRVRVESGAGGWTSREFVEPAPEGPPEAAALATAQAELAELSAASSARVAELESRLAEAHAAQEEADAHARELQTALGSATDRALELEAELLLASQGADQAGEDEDELAQELAAARQRTGEVEQELAELRATYSDMLVALRDENRGLEQMLAEARTGRDTALDALQEENLVLEKELAAARGRTAELEDAAARVAALESEQLAAKGSLDAARAANRDLQQRLAEAAVADLARPGVVADEQASVAAATPVALAPAPEQRSRSQSTAEIVESTAAGESTPLVESVAVDAGDTETLEAFVREWARAWSEQRVDDYLDFYSSVFSPANGMARAAWTEQRRARLSEPAFIEVTLDEIEVDSANGDWREVRFIQRYSSNSFSDTVRKTLGLGRENGVWGIVSENSEPLD